MSFRSMVQEDFANVFLNTTEFAEVRSVKFDGATYTGISVLLTREKSLARHIVSTFTIRDHATSLFRNDLRVHLRVSDIGGKAPEKGSKFYITKSESGTFFQEYYVTESDVDGFGVCILQLEDIDE